MPAKRSCGTRSVYRSSECGIQKVKEQDGADLLERILDWEKLNRAYKRVRANKGVPGIDGMTVEGVWYDNIHESNFEQKTRSSRIL